MNKRKTHQEFMEEVDQETRVATLPELTKEALSDDGKRRD